MPDWKALVRTRLAGLKLEGSNESEVFDELAQHLEDRYEELLQSGIPAAEAERIALEPLHTSPSLVEALSRASSAHAGTARAPTSSRQSARPARGRNSPGDAATCRGCYRKLSPGERPFRPRCRPSRRRGCSVLAASRPKLWLPRERSGREGQDIRTERCFRGAEDSS